MKHVHIIAEMACSHDGSAELAHTIIDGAGQAGADAIQFQIWQPENQMVPVHPSFPLLKQLELSATVWTELRDYVRRHYPAMEIVACVYDKDAADFAFGLGVNAFKIHAADITNPELLEHVAAKGKRIDLSVGGSSLDEIAQAIHAIRRTSDIPIWLMYGIQNFPTDTGAVHLAFMRKLADLFELSVGYQDHTLAEHPGAFWLPAAAIGMGIMITEKHITHDRSKKGADHQAALNPSEFKTFVEMVRTLEQSLGLSTPRQLTPDDLKYRTYSRKSLVALQAIEAGQTIHGDAVGARRVVATGVAPSDKVRVVGRKARRLIRQFEPIMDSDIE